MAIVIMGITAAAVLGALGASIIASASHRGVTQNDVLLKSYAETAKYQIELGSSPLYADCPTPNPSANTVLNAYKAGVTWAYPTGYTSGYTVTITGVEPWNSTSASWDSACPVITSAPNADANGLQRVTITATGPTNLSDTVQIIVRNPVLNTANAGF